ncbi:outer membrane beta-barrel protein [Fibrella aquatilis]|uniref:PorT family protein n=1 Tax=Fibrella aquatilis TaxID=2817059 RepID=A0A939JWB5_9BACT|nr:outer membrane beta-barrel protein [Fibrella aquatilis]MBO0929814.1 PorT family protein [Fibrella aquatilis]
MKTYLLLLLGALGCTPVFGQQWRIAPTVGVNLATISYSNAYLNLFTSNGSRVSPGFVPRWQVGALIDYTISEQVGIRSGLLYSTRGSNIQTSVTRSGYTVTASGSNQINYLDVPLLVTVGLGENGFRLVGGLVLGIALSGTSKTDAYTVAGYKFDGEEAKLPIGNSSNDRIVPTDVSVSLGILKQLDLNRRFLELGFHIQPSLSSFATGTKQYPSYTSTYFQFGLKASYFFDIGR